MAKASLHVQVCEYSHMTSGAQPGAVLVADDSQLPQVH